MLRKTAHNMALVAACMLTLSACSSSDDALSTTDNDNSQQQGKTPVELTVGIAGSSAGDTKGVTRGVVTKDRPYGQSATAFDAPTSLYMLMESKNHATPPTETKYARTVGTVAANAEPVSFTDGFKRYYEDAHSRNTHLAIYAACVPGKANALTIGGSSAYSENSFAWSTDAHTTTISWPMFGDAVATQNVEFMAKQDLCFSNNISNLTGNTPADNRIAFNTTTNKFTTDQTAGTTPVRGGRMVFYHALTKITFKIKKGKGFDDADFTFTNSGENIVLKGFNTGGTFSITDGEFRSTTSTTDIAALNNKGAEGDYAYVLEGFLVPGSVLNGTANDQVYFTIHHNTYHLTKDQLKTALAGEHLSDGETTALTAEDKMRPGVHYIFEMTVGKKEVDQLTAAVVPWEQVSAEVTPTNARIQVSLLNSGAYEKAATAAFDLYRLADYSEDITDAHTGYQWTWNTKDACGYSAGRASLVKNTAASTGEKTVYTATGWYWDNNKTFYHFRTVKPANTTVSTDATDADNKFEYLTLTGAESYTDICWGAPFYAKTTDNSKPTTTDEKLHYSTTTGFDNTTGDSHQISHAIGATNDVVNIELFHMFSDVTIKITTPTSDTDPDYAARVTLVGATVQLSNLHNEGRVRMDNGLVTTTDAAASIPATPVAVSQVGTDYQWHYGFVPQSLAGVTLTITTDNNRYEVDMATVVANSVGNNLIANPYPDGKVNYWYPNYKYTYTFKLKKTGIADITATLADWETVTAGDDSVVIK